MVGTPRTLSARIPITYKPICRLRFLVGINRVFSYNRMSTPRVTIRLEYNSYRNTEVAHPRCRNNNSSANSKLPIQLVDLDYKVIN